MLAAIAAAVILLAAPGVQSAPDDLLKLVPGDWPAVARVDMSASNASGAYLQKFKDDPQYVESVAAASRGFAKLIASFGIELDPEKGVLPWWAEKMAIGVDPMAKPIPRVIVAVACKDRELAKTTLNEAVGSVVRMVDPVVHQVSGAEVFIWKMPQENMTPSYAVGDGFVLFAESVDTIKAALAAGEAGALPAAAEQLKSHGDDIMSFAIDTEKLMKGIPTPEDGGMGKLSMLGMAGSVNPHGGVRLGDKGAVLSVFGKMPPMLAMMAGPFMAGTEAAGNVQEMLPRNSLAAMTAASAQMALPLEEKLKELGKSRPDLTAALLLLGSAGNAPAGVAMTALLPKPAYVLVVRTPDEAAAAALLEEFHKGLAKQGMRKGALKVVSPGRPAMAELIPAQGSADTLGFIGQSGSAVVFGSDWRSAQKTALVTPETSLASNPAYTGAMGQMPGAHAADAWMGLSIVSAFGDLYEAMGSRYTSPVMKWFTDALKGTNGLGAAVGLNEEDISVQLALGTEINPATPVIAVGGLLGAAVLGVTARETYGEVSDAKGQAQNAISVSNLKMLGIALRLYADDHNGKLPPAGTWPKALEPYAGSKETFKSPWADEGIVYKFNAKLGGLNEKDILNPAEVIAFFEWDTSVPLDYNVIAGPDCEMRVAYLDGHVETLSEPPGVKAFTPKLKAPAKPRAPVKKPAGKK